jgi:hypothetical protein
MPPSSGSQSKRSKVTLPPAPCWFYWQRRRIIPPQKRTHSGLSRELQLHEGSLGATFLWLLSTTVQWRLRVTSDNVGEAVADKLPSLLCMFTVQSTCLCVLCWKFKGTHACPCLSQHASINNRLGVFWLNLMLENLTEICGPVLISIHHTGWIPGRGNRLFSA